MAQAGGGPCRQSGLRWINSDVSVTPGGDYQMKRKEQTRHRCPSPLPHSHWLPPPAAEERNHGAVKYGCKMLLLRVCPLQPGTHACARTLGRQPGTHRPFRRAAMARDAIRADHGLVAQRPLISLGGRLTWESEHECALESRKYPPNVRCWSEP